MDPDPEHCLLRYLFESIDNFFFNGVRRYLTRKFVQGVPAISEEQARNIGGKTSQKGRGKLFSLFVNLDGTLVLER